MRTWLPTANAVAVEARLVVNVCDPVLIVIDVVLVNPA